MRFNLSHSNSDGYEASSLSSEQPCQGNQKNLDTPGFPSVAREMGGLSRVTGKNGERSVCPQVFYFGILNIFGSFERLLLRVFQDMQKSKLVKDRWEKRQPYLSLDGYKDCLKSIGINLTKSPFKWNDIIKLQTFRNAIAHQNGFVTEENVKHLKGYGYKLNGIVEIKESYFRGAVDMVNDSCSQLVKQYSRVLRKKSVKP